MDISLQYRCRFAAVLTRKHLPVYPEKGKKMKTSDSSLKHDKPADDGHSQKPQNHHLVDVNLDGVLRQIEKGEYIVSDLKAKLGVPADYELDIVVAGQFDPLDDNAVIKIKGGEVLVSHVRRGGSS